MVLELLLKRPGARITVMPAANNCVMKSMSVAKCGYDAEDRSWKTFESIVSESFGTFIYVLFFMICTDDKLKYSNDTVKNSLIIASSFIAAQMMGGGQFVTYRTGPCLNPAVAFGMAVFSANFNFPQYLLCPFLGALLALIFYEFVFVKTQEYLADDEEEGEEEEEEEEEPQAKGKNNQNQRPNGLNQQ